MHEDKGKEGVRCIMAYFREAVRGPGTEDHCNARKVCGWWALEGHIAAVKDEGDLNAELLLSKGLWV